MKDHRIIAAMRAKVPFCLGSKILDYDSGREYFDHRRFAAPYSGQCLSADNKALFETWIDEGDGARNWRVLATA
jgi:hypothetical protein